MKVKLVMAMTLDGRIAQDSDHFPDWTGKEDKRLFVDLTKAAGVLIMGSKTYDTIGKPLPGRLNIVMSRTSSRGVKNESLEYTNASPQEILDDLEARGYNEVVLAGGAQINTLFLEKGLIDELHVTISPLVFGGGLGLFAPGVSCGLQLRSSEVLGDDLVYCVYEVSRQ